MFHINESSNDLKKYAIRDFTINNELLPYNFTIISIFLPLLIHFISFPQIATFFHFIVFSITLLTVKFKTKYSYTFYSFSILWVLILIFHLFFKDSLDVFGFLQYYFYAFCFYFILKNSSKAISGDKLLVLIKKIYYIFLITLFIEFIFNLLGREHIFLSLFSSKEFAKNYQLLPSRPLMVLTGNNFSSLNSILFGPQSASMLTLMIMLVFNPFDFTNKSKSILFYLAFSLFIVANTMTMNLVFLIFTLHFIFFSKNSNLNRWYFKILIFILFYLLGVALIDTFFSVLQDDLNREIYLFKWTQPITDLSRLSTRQLFFGIPSTESIENITESWEFGFLQVIYLAGFMPVLFFSLLTFYLIVKLNYFSKYKVRYSSYYRVARISIFIVFICFTSLVHYAAVFSIGFFQLLGFHIAVILYSFDQMNMEKNYFIVSSKDD